MMCPRCDKGVVMICNVTGQRWCNHCYTHDLSPSTDEEKRLHAADRERERAEPKRPVFLGIELWAVPR